jgi:hypothetical protein
LASSSFAALTGDTVAISSGAMGGYIDPAIPRTNFRIRFDAAYDSFAPDRAEFFYAKCGCFGGDAPGPPLVERRINSYQEIEATLEFAVSQRFSGFIEVPYRLLNPEVNDNTRGISDVRFGAKYALIADPGEYLTAQLRVYTPTGDAFKGLGTNHSSFEPGLLYFRALSDRVSSESEVKLWVPTGGTDFQGSVLRYGTGLSCVVHSTPTFRVAPVGELVAWTVLGGQELDLASGLTDSADGKTIVNAKLGVRFGFGEVCNNFSRSDLYVGYGRALTGDVWYKDLFRIEYRLNY